MKLVASPSGADSSGSWAVERANRAATAAADRNNSPTLSAGFSRFSNAVARATGKPITFAISFLIIIAWAVTGPIFNYSDTWQLIINTGTTIVTFLMVFLIQNTQNRDGAALQAKLDELIRANQDARDAYMGIEKLPEETVEQMREACSQASPAPASRDARRRATR
jgi:low affinity Fe/Cu permease